MHEFSLCEALVRQVEALAEEQGSGEVKTVHLSIGPLSGVNADELRYAFPTASADTRAAGATLVIEQAPLRVRCIDCSAETDSDAAEQRCAQCGSESTQLISGDAVLITALDLATSD